jgi:hypothetical protein
MEDFKNAFATDKKAITSGGNNTADTDAGYIRLSATNSTTIGIKSCHKTGCSTAANRQESTVTVE